MGTDSPVVEEAAQAGAAESPVVESLPIKTEEPASNDAAAGDSDEGKGGESGGEVDSMEEVDKTSPTAATADEGGVSKRGAGGSPSGGHPAPIETATLPVKKTDVPQEILMLSSAKGRVELYLEKVKTPPHIRETLVELKDLQGESQKLEEGYRAEWNALKKKYLEKFVPVYEKRRDILTNNNAPGTVGTPKIPGFWYTALVNHNLIRGLVENWDRDALHYLQDITFDWVDPKEQTSYILSFYFSENPYFENRILTKTYFIERSDYDEEETVLLRTGGTEIKWYPNQNLTEKVLTRKQRNRRTGQTRVLVENVDQDSFFRFFKSTELPAEDEMDQIKEGALHDLEMIIEAEFEIGCTIRDKIIPRALGWHLGLEQESSDEESGNEGDGDSSDDSDD